MKVALSSLTVLVIIASLEATTITEDIEAIFKQRVTDTVASGGSDTLANDLSSLFTPYLALHERFRSKILMRLKGIPISNYAQLNKEFNVIAKQLEAQVSSAGVKSQYIALENAFKTQLIADMKDIINYPITTNRDGCWSSLKNQYTYAFSNSETETFIGQDVNDAISITKNMFDQIALDTLIAEVTADYVLLEASFKKCNYKWKCIADEVSLKLFQFPLL
jgi:hypothetical protein